MTIKEKRMVRRRRERVLMDALGVWTRAKDVMRREFAAPPHDRWPNRRNQRENARRARQIANGTLVASAQSLSSSGDRS